MKIKIQRKNKEKYKTMGAQETRKVTHVWYYPAVLVMIMISVVCTLTVFADEYTASLATRNNQEASNSRFDYVPRTASGVCPTGTTAYDEKQCFKIKQK